VMYANSINQTAAWMPEDEQSRETAFVDRSYLQIVLWSHGCGLVSFNCCEGS
jgi:hypothetical protein